MISFCAMQVIHFAVMILIFRIYCFITHLFTYKGR